MLRRGLGGGQKMGQEDAHSMHVQNWHVDLITKQNYNQTKFNSEKTIKIPMCIPLHDLNIQSRIVQKFMQKLFKNITEYMQTKLCIIFGIYDIAKGVLTVQEHC